MQITEISIESVDYGSVRAYVEIMFDNCFAVKDLRIIEASNKCLLLCQACTGWYSGTSRTEALNRRTPLIAP
jgi:SpoVG protein